MIDIVLGIICFTIILILFKVMNKYGADNLQVISFNYLTAACLSISLTSHSYTFDEITKSDWLFYAIGVGVMFIIVFNLLALATQKIGIAIATVANKMSVVIPVIAAYFLFRFYETAK